MKSFQGSNYRTSRVYQILLGGNVVQFSESVEDYWREVSEKVLQLKFVEILEHRCRELDIFGGFSVEGKNNTSNQLTELFAYCAIGLERSKSSVAVL